MIIGITQNTVEVDEFFKNFFLGSKSKFGPNSKINRAVVLLWMKVKESPHSLHFIL